ncbi:MAG: SGNH/GDSL hydrolase family protein [Symploca sp. SIO2C1]|nr:SGNH/GDSL hydrolase family protein [Symploca sp. SIO2C1]
MFKLKPWAQNLLLILGSVVSGIVIVEIGLRIAGISYPILYTHDQHRGSALRAGAAGWQRDEGEAYIQINSDGLRDQEHSKAKPENTLRIAVLGDSYAAALQIPMEKTFWSVMEKELSRCKALGGKDVEAINFGVSGYSTAQELITLRHHASDYEPDIVLLAFFTGNDIINNLIVLEPEKIKPFFIYQNGELVVDSSFRNHPQYLLEQSLPLQTAKKLSDYSRIIQVIFRLEDLIKASHYKRLQRNDSEIAELGLYHSIYKEATDSAWQEAWQVTEELVMLIRDEVREQKADFLVVTLSNGIQVDPDPSVRQEFIEKLGISDLFYPDRRIKTLGERENFTVLNLAQPFQAYAEKEQVFLHGFENTSLGSGHWNEEGHHLAGQMIAQKLCQDMIKDVSYSG